MNSAEYTKEQTMHNLSLIRVFTVCQLSLQYPSILYLN